MKNLCQRKAAETILDNSSGQSKQSETFDSPRLDLVSCIPIETTQKSIGQNLRSIEQKYRFSKTKIGIHFTMGFLTQKRFSKKLS